MGWSESYYADMQREAECEMRRCIAPLIEALEELRKTVATYREFTPSAEELEALLQKLEVLLSEFGAP